MTDTNKEIIAFQSRGSKLAVMACFAVAALMLLSSLAAHSAASKSQLSQDYGTFSQVQHAP